MIKSPVTGSVSEITDQLVQSETSSHFILIYPSIEVFRRLYTNYVKKQLKDGSGITIIISYYETSSKVKEVLSASLRDISGIKDNKGYNPGMEDNISEYLKEESLIIRDSVNAYFGPFDRIDKNIFMNFIRDLVKKAKNSGKKGISVIADVGSFYHHSGETQDLVDYELSLPSKYDDDLKLNGFCAYHKQDFNRRLTEEQKQSLIHHHGQLLIVEDK
jgi:hypothetical protein